MKTGLYALASLDGAPLSGNDSALLGLSDPHDSRVIRMPGLAVRAAYSEPERHAISNTVENDTLLVFLGHLDEPLELATKVGCNSAQTPASLALRAMRKWGAGANAHMAGEWSLLTWNAASRELIIGVSDTLRDVMRFSTDGHRVAVAPDVRRLSALAWVGREFDPVGLPLWVARASLRKRFLADRTILRNARAVQPGTCHTFSSGRHGKSDAQTASLPPRWEGSFEEAVTALETTARRIMRETLARLGTVAVPLSGGLDSSTLAWLAAEERRPGQSLFCMTSVAPEGSNLADERKFAEAVARTLHLPIEFVTPHESPSVYQPLGRTFAQADGPSQSPRHYLYDTLYDTAAAGGADAMLDGAWGELTLTRPVSLQSPLSELRKVIREAKGTAREWLRGATWPDAGFHAKLSHDALQRLPLDIRAQHLSLEKDELLHPDEELGFGPGFDKVGILATSAPLAGLRHLTPYRDQRLALLAAGMPAHFACHDRLSRALARAMLKNRLPDEIRLRTHPRPFSPDYSLRLQRQAHYVKARMAVYRRSDARDWINLPWLEGQTEKLSRGGALPITGQFNIQMTAMMAEFFVWWETQELD